MTVYKEWVDFVMYGNPNKVQSRKDRLDTKNAIRPTEPQQLKDNSFLASVSKRGLLLTKEIVLNEGEEFEAMEVAENGIVTIWTDKRVGKILPKDTEGMVFFLRNPPGSTDSSQDVFIQPQPIDKPSLGKNGSTSQSIEVEIEKI